MMFGTRTEYDYFACSVCECLQIANIPEDPGGLYPDRYYSFAEPAIEGGLIKSFLKHQRALYGLGKTNLLGRVTAGACGLPEIYGWLKRANVTFKSRILDVGCGSGFLLTKLKEEGFTNLVGIDPHLESDVVIGGTIKIFKRELHALDMEFDFIILNHSFEHMADPLKALSEIKRVLRPKSYALIRIPVIPSFAWRNYGVNWVQLDAPRHLFIHSVQSMKILASRAGFDLAEVVYDSEDLQFWGSELYQRNIPFTSYRVGIDNELFSTEEMNRFKSRARELNAQQDGDQASFYLFKN
jgi:SAM-dependent methyltransferase